MTLPITPPPVLEVFYAPSCGPCRLELPAVAAFSREGSARIRLVIVSEESRARDMLREVSPPLDAEIVTRTDASPGAVLRDAGDAYSILPYARSMTSTGMICAHWGGQLTVAKAHDLIAACSHAATSPPSRRS